MYRFFYLLHQHQCGKLPPPARCSNNGAFTLTSVFLLIRKSYTKCDSLPVWEPCLEVIKVLLDFSLTVKATTLIFISGRGSAISSAKEGKSGFIYKLVKS